MSTTITSPPLDSQFRDGPVLPIIRGTPTASWPSVAPDVKPHVLPVAPILNKIYFSKKVYNQTLKTYDPNGQYDTVRVIWEIPFSVDVNEPVTELTQRIHAAMTAKKIYKHWDINFSNFTILAVEEISALDYIRS
jgi:hypothetical protein